MTKYEVETRAKIIYNYTVNAENEEDAKDKVLNGCEDLEFGQSYVTEPEEIYTVSIIK